MADFEFNPALLRIPAVRRLQEAINRRKLESSGASTWAAPLIIFAIMAIVAVESLVFGLASHNKGLRTLLLVPAVGIFVLIFVLLHIATRFLPRPRKWVRWTVWSLTVIGLQSAVFVAVLAFGLVNRYPEAAGLSFQMLGWSLFGIAAFSIVLLSMDLWRGRRGKAGDTGENQNG